jgi:hypothetical protein
MILIITVRLRKMRGIPSIILAARFPEFRADAWWRRLLEGRSHEGEDAGERAIRPCPLPTPIRYRVSGGGEKANA